MGKFDCTDKCHVYGALDPKDFRLGRWQEVKCQCGQRSVNVSRDINSDGLIIEGVEQEIPRPVETL